MMDEENIKRAFQKAKEDIYYLSKEIAILRENLIEINEKIEKISKNQEKNI